MNEDRAHILIEKLQTGYEIRSKKIEYSRKSGFQAQHTESAFLKLYSMTRTGT